MSSKPSRPTTSRRFTVLDGMIVIGAVALGLAPLRWIDSKGNPWSLIRELAPNFAWDWDWFDQLAVALLILATPPMVSATLAVLAMRLRKPRPRWRRLARQPGFAACLALLMGWAVGATFTVVNVLSIDSTMPTFKDGTTYAQQAWAWAQTFAEWGSLLGGFGVLVAWAMLALAGRWQAEPTWLDRLGRLAGLGWIALALAACFVMRTING